VVGGAVRTCHARAIDYENHRQLVQRHVHDRLVERAGEKRRIDADDRVHAGHRQARGERNRVLLADADVEKAVGEFFGEVQETG
jgi:hypothetical protein